MPSKGGARRQGNGSSAVAAQVLAGPVAVPVAEDSIPSGFTEHDLARPLRRGAEFDRFRDLASRAGALTPEESDELYRYRLRRLWVRLRTIARSLVSGQEVDVRAALEDFRGRLLELQRLEDERAQAGLANGHGLDLSVVGRAEERLSDLALSRERGLVAGAEEASELPAGSERVRDLAFRPGLDDVPIVILAPPSVPSERLLPNVQALQDQGARIQLVTDAAQIPREGTPPLVLNWGSSDSLPQGLVALNRPEAVRIASDQLESLRRLQELAPRTVVNPHDIGLLGSDHVVAKRRHGSRGSGKAVLAADASVRDLAGYDLYQRFIPDRREYRISVLSGRIVSAYRKLPPDGAAAEELRPQWTFERAVELPRGVAQIARDAAARIGLDYAGVDVVEDTSSGHAYCLEANSAPGMSEETVRNLYAHLQRTLRGRLARAG